MFHTYESREIVQYDKTMHTS